jgi:hypothetical protein
MCLAHGALQPEQEAIIELSRIIDAILIQDQRIGQGAQLDEPMPVGRVARQPGNLQP